MSEQSPGSTQDLCLSCGLCCDGTIFRTVPLDDTDAIQPLQSAGAVIDVESDAEGEHRYLRQPCPAHDGSCCTIYTNRPAKCQQFKCLLLKAVENRQLEFDAASTIIRTAKERRNEVLADLADLNLPFESERNLPKLLFLIVESLRAADEDKLKSKLSDLALKVSALVLFVSANFKNLERKRDGDSNRTEISQNGERSRTNETEPSSGIPSGTTEPTLLRRP